MIKLNPVVEFLSLLGKNMKKVAIIGIGGRTGTMFAFEMRNSVEILGVGREKEVKEIKEGKFFVERNNEIEIFKERVIRDIEFKNGIFPEIVFLATKNPISPIIKYYFSNQKIKENFTLLISQNGISAIEDAKESLKEIFGNDFEKIRLVRIILFNPVEKVEKEGKIFIKYSLPIRIAIAKVFGPGKIEDILKIFKESNFEVFEFPEKEAKNLEFSKLILNLIGMASATHGLSIEEGFENKEIFREEIGALREYIKLVKIFGGKFLNFPHYPVKLMTILFNLPLFFLSIFRKKLARLISQERRGKRKDLDEIDYYNGAVVELGKKLKIETPINERILKRGKFGRGRI